MVGKYLVEIVIKYYRYDDHLHFHHIFPFRHTIHDSLQASKFKGWESLRIIHSKMELHDFVHFWLYDGKFMSNSSKNNNTVTCNRFLRGAPDRTFITEKQPSYYTVMPGLQKNISKTIGKSKATYSILLTIAKALA
jgi:hypothetical protein